MVISEPILNEFNLDLEKLIKKYVDKIELKQWKTEQLKNIDIKINRETNKDYNLLFSVFLEKLKKLKTYIQAKDITELKKAEVKLRESEERFKYLVSSSPAIIYTSRITGDYGATFISDNVKNLWGYDSKSFTEDPGFWLSSVHPDDKERVLSILSELIDKEHIIYDYRCKIMNSTYRWMRDEVYLLKDNAGNPLEAIGSEIDITDRKLSEQKLMESEEKFRSIAEQSLMGIGILQDEVFKYINEQFANIYGYSVDEILNWPEKEFYKLTHLEDLEFAMEQAQKKQLGAPDVINRYQFRGVKKKGEIIWLEIISHTFSYENKPADLITILDITERKRAEQKLKESEEKFSKAFQSGPNLMAITRREDGYFIDVNDAYIQSLGYNREELIGHSSIEVNIWANSEQRIEFIQKLKESDRVESFEVEVNTKSGKKLTMLFSGEVINLNNEPHLITIANDITDRIKAEKALKESKQLFERTLYSLHDAVFIIDAQTVEILDCNPAASEIFGYSHEDMSGQTTTFLHINEEHLEEFRRNLNHAIEKYGFLKNIEFKMKRKDGTIFNTEHSVLPLLDEKEHQFGWVSVVRDITERKNAEQKLRESEEKYRHLFEKSPFSIVLFDSEGIIKDCNSVTEEMFGFTKEDFLGKNYYHNPSINSDHLPITKKIYDQLKEGESLLPQEMKIFRADGTSLWINSQISRVKIINQTYFYSIIQDITNKKILEDIMFELNQNFFNFTSDFQENIQSLTQTAKKLSKGTLVLYAKKVFHEDDSTVQIISSSNGVINCDFTDFKQKYFINEIFKLKHETPQIFQNLNSNDYTMADSFVQKYSLKGAYGKIIKNTDDFTSIIAILYENIPEISYEEQLVLLLISDAIAIEEKRWQLLEKLEEQNTKLSEIDKLKSEFLRRISHELKTPLISIKGYSQLLLYNNKGNFDNDTLTMIEEITRGCVRLENLIKELIESSKLESAQVKLKLTFEDLALLINNSVNELQGVAKSRNQEIILNIHEKLITKFEKERIHEVIGNLLTNAIKYSPPSNSIVIKSEISDGFYVISVKDNGVGFTPGEKQKLFKQFGKIYRFDQETNLAAEGSGLGLYITKKLVELHGGKIWVESEGRDKGSTFYFTLPIIKD